MAMTADQLKEAQRRLSMSDREFADRLAMRPDTLRKRKSGKARISAKTEAIVRELLAARGLN